MAGRGADFELADVLGRHGEAFRRAHEGHLGRVERRVMAAIEACRTASLGGHVEACEDCGSVRIAYNSCRNRHCPKCQGAAREEWLAARRAELLDVPYFHVVFTVPAPIAAIAFQNKAAVYAILFSAAARAMTELAANPRRLGANIGFLAILHTWGQTLTHHPHVHCVVPGGGLSPDGRRWIAARPAFFLAVKPLAKLFRGIFLDCLSAAFAAGKLSFFGDLAVLADRARFDELIAAMRRVDWVVYCKKPFGGPERVLAYLGRYTHRVAIANSRLLAVEDDHVAFSWRDYRAGGASKIMRLAPDEFIRRFLLHVLARRLPSHPSLRLHGQWPARREDRLVPRTDRRAIGLGETSGPRPDAASHRTRRFLLPRMWRSLARHRSLRHLLRRTAPPTVGMAMRYILRTPVPILRLPIEVSSSRTAAHRGEGVRPSHLKAKSILRPAPGPASTFRQRRKRSAASANSRPWRHDATSGRDTRSRSRHQSP
jgi:hypothetical protein